MALGLLSKQAKGGCSSSLRIAATKLHNSANENSNQEDAEKDSSPSEPNQNKSNHNNKNVIDNRDDDDDDDDNNNNNDKDKDKDNDNNPNLLTYEELIRDPQYAQIEYNKARQRRNKLFLMQDLGKAFNVLLYTFVITSILLQTVGYGFVIIPDHGEDTNTGFRLGNSNVKIDTLENKAFLMEMNGQDQQAERIRRKYLKNYNEL